MSSINEEFKLSLYEHCVEQVEQKAARLHKTFREQKESLQSETKSTAGDKHETGRAMIQLEQEKMGRQLLEVQKLQKHLQRINPGVQASMVQSGALVSTNKGHFFIAIGLGLVELEESKIFVMAPTAPLAQHMLGKQQGEKLSFNGQLYEILAIC